MANIPMTQVAEILKRAAKMSPDPGDPDEGWTESKADPMRLLAAFRTLKIQPGFILRAFQFREGGNGNGFVWAMPRKAALPDPADCPRLAGRFLEPPKPPDALDNLMEAIEGDGSPRSYLEASLFARAAGDFGAMWHGCDWSTHRILGGNPWRHDSSKVKALPAPSLGDQKGWRWIGPRPRRWGPTVKIDRAGAVVRFLTHTGLGQERISRFTDTFAAAKYTFETTTEVVAEGPGGFVF